MFRRVVMSLAAAALALAPVLRAGDAGKPVDNPSRASVSETAAVTQEVLSRQFRDFEQQLLRLALRLEQSGKPEDRERAKSLKKAIAVASGEALDNRFDKLVQLLKKSELNNLQDVKEAIVEGEKIAQDLRKMLAALLADKDLARLKEKRRKLTDIKRRIDEAIRTTKTARAITESGRMDKDELAKIQAKATRDTEAIARELEEEGAPGGEKTKNHVNSAARNQQNAGKNIAKGNNDGASSDQSRAIEDLNKARDEIEQLLRQVREEEIKQMLANLEARCRLLLQMQIEVQEGTIRVDQAIARSNGRQPTRGDLQKSLRLSDREGEIVKQADQAVQLLEAEGSAVAFTEVFVQVRDDMKTVQRRLGKADVGKVTQVIEDEIIATLQEMIEALKKAQQPSNDPSPPNDGKPPDPKLVDKLAELKMIRSMQVRINGRTQTYARQYTGEQADDPDIQKELRSLAERQKQIQRVTRDLSTGKNQTD